MKPFIVSPLLREGCLGWDESLMAANTDILVGIGGGRIFHRDKYGGTYQYGDIENWSLCSHSASISVNEHIKCVNATVKIAIGFDTPYAALGSTLSKDVLCIWVPHSTGVLHEVDGIQHDQSRYQWEQAGVELAVQRKNCYLGAIGDFMHEHLAEHFGAHRDRILMLRNGLVATSTASSINYSLDRFGFRPNETVIFSTGRAEKYKGFGDLVEAFHRLDTNAKLLIIASRSTQFCPVFNEIEQAVHDLGTRAVLAEGFITRDEIAEIVRDPRTRVVTTPSHGEPFGMLPVETRCWMTPPGPVLVSSDRHGLKEQIADGKDGLMYECGNVDSLAMALEEALCMTDEQRNSFFREGKRRLENQHHYPANIERFIIEVINRWKEA
jgi:glycosyltransferase involved in cell wall biosynthesis